MVVVRRHLLLKAAEMVVVVDFAILRRRHFQLSCHSKLIFFSLFDFFFLLFSRVELSIFFLAEIFLFSLAQRRSSVALLGVFHDSPDEACEIGEVSENVDR